MGWIARGLMAEGVFANAKRLANTLSARAIGKGSATTADEEGAQHKQAQRQRGGGAVTW